MHNSHSALRMIGLSVALGVAAFSQQAAAKTTPSTGSAASPTASQTASPSGTSTNAAAVNADADNSKMNKQYDGKTEATADQQSNNENDVQIITKIRRALTDDDSLSTYAHNIKILADKGHVTLKGPVRSVDEKKKVEAIASKEAGKNPVKSELKVTTN